MGWPRAGVRISTPHPYTHPHCTPPQDHLGAFESLLLPVAGGGGSG